MKIKLSFFIFFLSSLPLLLYGTPKFDFEVSTWNLYVIITVLIFYIMSSFFIQRLFSGLKKLKTGIETMKDQDYTLFLNENATNEFELLVNVYNEMMEKLRVKRVENRQLQLYFENIIQRLPFAVIILKDHSYLNFANNQAEKLLKFNSSKLINKKLHLINHYLVDYLLDDDVKSGKIINQYGIRIKIIKSAFTREGIRFQLIVLEELTSNLIETQLESWKKMIRIMSHEINNSISPIISITQSLLSYLEKIDDFDVELKEGVTSISSRLKHLSSFINDYSNIAKIPNLKRQDISLNDFFNRIITFMGNTKNNKVNINFLNLSNCEFIFIDENLFEQSIINIIKNGIEASEKNDIITIDITIDRIRERHHIIIKDYGSGIPEEAFDNLFVPYFTTKSTGNGIGLSFVQEILSKHDFKYFIESKENEGTSFFIEIH